MGIMKSWNSPEETPALPQIFVVLRKGRRSTCFWTGLFSVVNYFLSIIIKETMIAIKVPNATISDKDS